MGTPLRREESLFPSPPTDWEKRLIAEVAARSGSPERVSEANAAGRSAAVGEAAAGARPSNTHLLNSQSSPPSITIQDGIRHSYNRLLLNSDGYSGPVESPDLYQGAVAAFDWIEESGLVAWNREISDGELFLLDRIQEDAKSLHQPHPYLLANQDVLVSPRGIGTGRQERLEYRIEIPGITLAFSARESDNRQHANFYLKITGEACVLYGGLKSRTLAYAIMDSLGGHVYDSWIRRLDLCLDVPNLSVEDWIRDAFRSDHYITTATEQQERKTTGRKFSGFSVGASGTWRLQVYDKLEEVKKRPEDYQLAMQARWGGSLPTSATRIEYQIRRPWLREHVLNSTEDTLLMVPSILHLFTEVQKRPRFVFTAGPVDQKNNHQSRIPRHPEWAKVVATFRDRIETPTEPVKRLDRGGMASGKATNMAVGCVLSAAANRGALIASRQELAEQLVTLLEANDITDEEIAAKSLKKCRSKNTLQDAMDFPFGANVTGETLGTSSPDSTSTDEPF
ncbi:hypothetical protein [Planctomicrobium sp. SH527]|uniref:hypothetical protein n=1 Tax=Planctomicrobium sp. SH527 TaxID=3448123 RepID=UPI003F5BB1EB